jgi:hypothetical protein
LISAKQMILINLPTKKNNLLMKSLAFIALFIILFSLIGCSQNENKYFKETRKLVSLIVKEDTIGIQKLIVARLEDVPALKNSMWHNMQKYNKLISRFGSPTKYKLMQYSEGDIKLCDVIVKVGNEEDYGILTASFYRNYERDSIFLFDLSFDTNAKGLIDSPSNR